MANNATNTTNNKQLKLALFVLLLLVFNASIRSLEATNASGSQLKHQQHGSSGDDDSKLTSHYKIVCYYTNWSQYRISPARFYPENINPHLCTHVIFAFAKINKDSELEAFEWNDESTSWSKGMYQRTVELKTQNKDLKVLLAVGGWNHNSLPFSNMVVDDELRAKFITKTIDFLIKNQLDGLDIDWEYPANRDTQDRPDDKYYFTILCRVIISESYLICLLRE